MRKFSVLIILVMFAGCRSGSAVREVSSDSSRVLFVIAPQDFRDEELVKPRRILQDKGYKVLVASVDTAPATGMLGLTVKPDLLISEVNTNDYVGLVIVGGTGIQELWDDTTLFRVVDEFNAQNKVIGAICMAPVVLGRAGILEGLKATCSYNALEELKAEGAQYIPEDIVLDGKILTCNGPAASEWFGLRLLELLEQESK